RELERLDDLSGWAPTAHACRLAASRQAPGAPAVRPQTFGHGATREPSKLSDLLHAELAQLGTAAWIQRHEFERQRREELGQPLVRDDQHLATARDRRGRERSKPPLRSADPRIPARSDGGERTPERRLEPAVEPLDSARLEVDRARP